MRDAAKPQPRPAFCTCHRYPSACILHAKTGTYWGIPK